MNTALREEAARIRWFHTIDLGEGVVTSGIDRTAAKLRRIGLPADLTGKSVLDIGAFDGFFSFEAERRGAKRVVAVDRWAPSGWGCRAGFDLAHRVFGSKVEPLQIDLLDLTARHAGVFDIVIFLGVLYHLRDPHAGLERVRAVTGERLILETHVDMLHRQTPESAYYGGAELNGDASNWWGPNPPAIADWLAKAGFARSEQVFVTSPLWRCAHSLFSGGTEGYLTSYRRGRAVFHAFPG